MVARLVGYILTDFFLSKMKNNLKEEIFFAITGPNMLVTFVRLITRLYYCHYYNTTSNAKELIKKFPW